MECSRYPVGVFSPHLFFSFLSRGSGGKYKKSRNVPSQAIQDSHSNTSVDERLSTWDEVRLVSPLSSVRCGCRGLALSLPMLTPITGDAWGPALLAGTLCLSLGWHLAG